MARILLVFSVGSITGVTWATPQEQTRFDHFTTGFELRGAHTRAACASCHAGGVFNGTPRTCVGCHSESGLVTATHQPSHHVLTTNQCGSCHQPHAWTPTFRVDHLEVIGTCASCHNNVRVRGQPVDHIPTTQDCGSCHNTSLFGVTR